MTTTAPQPLPPHDHPSPTSAPPLPANPSDPTLHEDTLYLAPRIEHTIHPIETEEVHRLVNRERHVHHVVMHYQPVLDGGVGGAAAGGEAAAGEVQDGAPTGTYTTQNHIHTHVRPPIYDRPTNGSDATTWTEQNPAFFTAPSTPLPQPGGRASDPIAADYARSHPPSAWSGAGLEDTTPGGRYAGIGNAEYIEAPPDAGAGAGGKGRFVEGSQDAAQIAREEEERRRRHELEGGALGAGAVGAGVGLEEHHRRHEDLPPISTTSPTGPNATQGANPNPGAALSPSASTRRRLQKPPAPPPSQKEKKRRRKNENWWEDGSGVGLEKTPFWRRVLFGKEVLTKRGRVEHVLGCFR